MCYPGPRMVSDVILPSFLEGRTFQNRFLMIQSAVCTMHKIAQIVQIVKWILEVATEFSRLPKISCTVYSSLHCSICHKTTMNPGQGGSKTIWTKLAYSEKIFFRELSNGDGNKRQLSWLLWLPINRNSLKKKRAKPPKHVSWPPAPHWLVRRRPFRLQPSIHPPSTCPELLSPPFFSLSHLHTFCW